MTEASKEGLRDFQNRLADKLKAADGTSGSVSKLGFIAGGQHWLVSLDQVNEVVTVKELAEVPWARPWFVGVAGVRGVLYGCTDLAAFVGIAEPMARGETRMLLAHPGFGVNAALRIDQALGLRSSGDMEQEPSTEDSAPWMIARWRGKDGVVWTEISIERLVTTPAFLEVAL